MRRPIGTLLWLLAAVGGCGDGGSSVQKQPLEPIVPSRIAGDAGAPFDERVRTIYNFKPARTSRTDQQVKSDEMDALWQFVDRNPKATLPLLRKELLRKEQNPFFCFDGAQLLLKHSKAPEDLQLAADSIGRAELDDVQRMDYFRATHRLAVNGANVWSCVNRILDDKEFKVYIPQHALMMRQIEVVVYCLLPMKEEQYFPFLTMRLQREKDPTALKSLLAGLSLAVTPEAQGLLRDFARATTDSSLRELAESATTLPSRKEMSGKAEGTREQLFVFLNDLVAGRYDNPAYSFEKFKKGAPHLVRKEDLPKIRELRRTHASRVSDEAIEELQYLTHLMKAAFASEE